MGRGGSLLHCVQAAESAASLFGLSGPQSSTLITLPSRGGGLRPSPTLTGTGSPLGQACLPRHYCRRANEALTEEKREGRTFRSRHPKHARTLRVQNFLLIDLLKVTFGLAPQLHQFSTAWLQLTLRVFRSRNHAAFPPSPLPRFVKSFDFPAAVVFKGETLLQSRESCKTAPTATG